MAIALVQHVQNSAASATSLTVTLASTTAGNCLVACVGASGATAVSSITLGGAAGNFSQLASQVQSGGAGGAFIWADPGCAGVQTSVVITVNGASSLFADVYEVSGLTAFSVLDKSSTGFSNTAVTSWSSGATATTAQASEFWCGTVLASDFLGGGITGPSAPWTNETSQSLGFHPYYQLSGFQITTGTGAATYSGTTANVATYVAAAVTLLPSTVGNAGVAGKAAPVTVTAPAGTVPVSSSVTGTAAAVTVTAPAGAADNGRLISHTYWSAQPPVTALSSLVWTDISTFAEVGDSGGQAVQISHGRQDPLSDVGPATLTCTLDNSDGRFTPGTSTDIGLRKGSWIRQTVTYLGNEYPRFTGFVSSQPAGNMAGSSVVQLQASDWMLRLGQRSALYSIYAEEVLTDPAYAGKITGFWPLNESTSASTSGTTGATNEGFTSAGDLSANATPLTVANIGSGMGAQAGAIQFGQDQAPGFSGDAAVTFTPLNLTNGQILTGALAKNLGADFTVEFWLQAAGTSSMPVIAIADFTAGIQLVVSRTAAGNLTVAGVRTAATSTFPVSSTTFDAWIANLDWHHVWLQFHHVNVGTSSYQVRCMVDGVSRGTSPTWLQLTSALNWVNLGGRRNPAPGATFDGNLYGLCITTSNPSSLPVSHYLAGATGFTGELTSARMARLARYAGIPASWTNFPATSTLAGPQSVIGRLAIDAMRDASGAEAMPLYVAGDGRLTMTPRVNRVNPASAFTIHASDMDPSTVTADDFSYLINEIDVAQPEGATIKVTGPAGLASQALFERYSTSVTAASYSDADAMNLGTWLIYLNSNPAPRWSVTVEASTLANVSGYGSAWRKAVLSAEVSTAFTIDQLLSYMPGAAAGSVALIIEGWTETIDAATHTFAFSTSDATLLSGMFEPLALNSNPGMRSNVTGWAATGGTLAFSAANQYLYNFGPGVTAPSGTPAGTGAGLLTPDGVTGNPFIESAKTPAVAGQQYTAGAWVLPVSLGHVVEIGISWYNGSNALISSSVKPFSLGAGAWSYILSPLFTAPANTATATIRIGRNQQYGTVTTLTTGSGNYTAPLTGTARVAVWGAGGGGASGGRNGGAGGEFAENLAFAITNLTNYPYAVGAGGAAGTSAVGQAGSAGANSTFNTSSVVAHGGGGGTVQAWSFAPSGTPVNSAFTPPASNYFIATTGQAASISAGDVFRDAANPSTAFTVTVVAAAFAGFQNISFTPSAPVVMDSSDTVTGAHRPQGGTASAAPVHFNGGNGGMQTGTQATGTDGGGGGGGSGGPQNPGAQGGDTPGGLSGLGAVAVPGGGPGGTGGVYSIIGPTAGFIPATGPGGGGGAGATGKAGAAGSSGQIVISPVGAVPPASALLYVNDAELTGPAAVADSLFLLPF